MLALPVGCPPVRRENVNGDQDAWAGTFGETKDWLAYVGLNSEWPNAYFALGYGVKGATMSVVAAGLIADG